MTTELVDFDAARADREDVPLLTVKAGGRRIDLLRPTAAAVLNFLRAMREPAKQSTSDVLELYEGLFGDNLAHLQTVLSTAELNELAGRYCGAAMKEGTSPNRATRRAAKRRSPSTSSNAGRSSRPTSSANTASTSASR